MGRRIYSGYSDHHDDGDDPYGQASGDGHNSIHIFDRGRLLRSSFDGKRSTVRDRRNYPHARGFSRCRRELTDDATRVVNPNEPGCPRLVGCPRWVKVRPQLANDRCPFVPQTEPLPRQGYVRFAFLDNRIKSTTSSLVLSGDRVEPPVLCSIGSAGPPGNRRRRAFPGARRSARMSIHFIGKRKGIPSWPTRRRSSKRC
jgi:hypothetical protein